MNGRKKFDFAGQKIRFKRDPSGGECWNSQLGETLLIRLLKFEDGWRGIAFTCADLKFHQYRVKKEGRRTADALRNWDRIDMSTACDTPEEAVAKAEKIAVDYFRRLGGLLGYEVER